jgi:uncharacterized protein (DUF1800 family)
MVTKQVKNQHLLWRCSFGANLQDVPTLYNSNPKDLYAQIEKKSVQIPTYLDVVSNEGKSLLMEFKKGGQNMRDSLSAEQKKQIRMQNAAEIKNLTVAWLDTMVNTDAQLREKMAFFWHGHFACRIVNIYYQQLLLNNVRLNAIGNFGDLLKSVSKSASMLQFLNNQQNRKEHPNENFAREVMELFTLGRGNYTEKDVKEAARAFTGWGFDADGNFVARPFAHDNGSKTFLGKTGNFNGDDILNILLEQKQTAFYITKKIYRYFVNDSPDTNHIQWLAGRFYQSNYDIGGLMRDIFTADWFYDEKNIGQRIKSPIELIAGIRRTLPMTIQNPEIQILLQRVLGQLLFNPPNVAGWPGGKSWIDSSSLMLRLRLPQLIKDNTAFSIKPKADDDQQMGMKENFKNVQPIGKSAFQLDAAIQWDAYINTFSQIPKEQLYNNIEGVLLQTKPGSVSKTAVLGMTDNSTRENYIKTTTIALMSTPEYQLC